MKKQITSNPTTTRPITMKLLETKDEDKILKTEKENNDHIKNKTKQAKNTAQRREKVKITDFHQKPHKPEIMERHF